VVYLHRVIGLQACVFLSSGHDKVSATVIRARNQSGVFTPLPSTINAEVKPDAQHDPFGFPPIPRISGLQFRLQHLAIKGAA
jgi:hypothetical protein